MSVQEDTYPLAEAAARAGIEPPELDQMVELQMIVPRDDGVFTSGDVRKAALLAGLGAGGLPLEAIAAEIRGGRLSVDFMDDPIFGGFSALSPLTFDRPRGSNRHPGRAAARDPRGGRLGRAPFKRPRP